LLVAEGPPYAIPTFQAHRVELVTPSRHRKFYRAVDGTGDALVIEVTNNEKFPIHICVMSYQADGSIVVLYPPKKVSNLYRIFRLRVVPLLLGPSCVARKKIARKKWPREILGAGSRRKEGLPTKPKSDFSVNDFLS